MNKWEFHENLINKLKKDKEDKEDNEDNECLIITMEQKGCKVDFINSCAYGGYTTLDILRRKMYDINFKNKEVMILFYKDTNTIYYNNINVIDIIKKEHNDKKIVFIKDDEWSFNIDKILML